VLIEDAASGTSLIQTTKQQGLQGVIGLKPTTDKETRMYTQTAKLEAKSLFVPKNAHWLNDFMTEYLSFPKCRHDDQIDALSQFLLYRTNKEIAGVFRFDFGHDGDEGSGPDPIRFYGGSGVEAIGLSRPFRRAPLWAHVRQLTHWTGQLDFVHQPLARLS
jgi:Terminase RNaseH-like domain